MALNKTKSVLGALPKPHFWRGLQQPLPKNEAPKPFYTLSSSKFSLVNLFIFIYNVAYELFLRWDSLILPNVYDETFVRKIANRLEES